MIERKEKSKIIYREWENLDSLILHTVIRIPDHSWPQPGSMQATQTVSFMGN